MTGAEKAIICPLLSNIFFGTGIPTIVITSNAATTDKTIA